MVEDSSPSKYEMETPLTSDGTKEEYKVYKMRFFIAFLFCVASTNGVLVWLIWVPIQSLLVRDYELSTTIINFSTILIANVTMLPTSIYGNYILDEYGLRLGMIIGCITTALGLWIRVLCNESFYWILVGQIVASLGQPFFYNTPQKVSQVWFGPHERTLATAVITGVFTLAMAIGTVLPAFLMDITTTDVSLSKSQLQNMMYELAIVGTACFIPTILFFKNTPPTPPSRAAAAQKLHFKTALKSLLRNKNYLILLIGASVITASLINSVSVMQLVTEPWGIDANAFSLYSAIGIIVGLIATVLVGYIVTKTKKFRLILLLLCVLGSIFIPLTYFGAMTEQDLFWGIAFVLYAASQCPLLAVGLEFTLEVAFPVPEATSAGIIVVLGSILSTVESVIIDEILGKEPSKESSSLCFIIMSAVQILGCLILLFVKEDLRRSNYEQGLLKNLEIEEAHDSELKTVTRLDHTLSETFVEE